MFGAAAPGGPPSVPQPVQILEQEWVKEEWIEGAPNPVMALGALSQGALVRITERFMNVHFVGTETADVWRGYMEGAVRSGERGAKGGHRGFREGSQTLWELGEPRVGLLQTSLIWLLI